jgi:hypothetical protein
MLLPNPQEDFASVVGIEASSTLISSFDEISSPEGLNPIRSPSYSKYAVSSRAIHSVPCNQFCKLVLASAVVNLNPLALDVV